MWHDELNYSPTDALLRYALFAPIVMCFDQDEKTKTTSGYSPSAQEKKISTGLGEAYLPQIGQQTPFPGERVAPFTGQQAGAISDLDRFTQTFQPFQDIPLYSEGGAALRNILTDQGESRRTPGVAETFVQGQQAPSGYAQEYAERYDPQRSAQPQAPITEESAARMFQSIYGDPARKEYKETVAPAIKEEFAGPGYWGGARARAGMEGSQDLQDWLGTKGGEFERDVFARKLDIGAYNAQLDRDAANLASSRAGLSAQLGRDETALAQSRAGLDVTLTEQQAQEERDRRAGVFGAVDRTADYLATPARVSGEALAGRADVFNVAGAEQQQAQNVINAEMQKYTEQYNITDPQTLSVLSMLLNMRYGTTTERSVDRASEFQEATPYARAGAAVLGAM